MVLDEGCRTRYGRGRGNGEQMGDTELKKKGLGLFHIVWKLTEIESADRSERII